MRSAMSLPRSLPTAKQRRYSGLLAEFQSTPGSSTTPAKAVRDWVGTLLANRWWNRAWWPAVIPVILMILMKTAISLPDELFHAVNAKARALKMSRSGLLAQAAREFIERHGPQGDATEAWNRAIARAGQPGDEAAAVAFRTRTKRLVRESWRKGR